MKKIIWFILVILIVSIGGIFYMTGLFGGRVFIVGKDIQKEEIQEFYYTISSSTFPPKYQRYHFFVEDEKKYFYHEKREGEVFPLTEEYITVSGKKELTEEEWDVFYQYIKDGKVIARQESITSGDRGPFLYLYWKNDRSKIQQFSFGSYQAIKEFEEYCIKLSQ